MKSRLAFEFLRVTGENPAVNHKSIRFIRAWVLSLCLCGFGFNVSAQGTAFTYQGNLETNGVPVTGLYSFTFTLFNAATGGSAVSVTQTNTGVSVANGLFTTNLDFGPIFNGSNYWLAIGVTTNNGTVFTVLSPRQQILPVPYAIFATSASNLTGTLSSTQLSGALPSAQIAGNYTGTVNFSNAANSFSGTFFGNGAGLTNLNASSIASGTLADARLSGNVALLNANNVFSGNNTFSSSNNFTGPNSFSGANTFSGANSFTNRNNAFTGSFFGNGLVGWVPVSGTTQQALPNTAYLLLNTNPVTVTLPSAAQGLVTGDVVRVAGPYNGGWSIAQNAGQSVVGIFLNPTNASWLPASATSVAWRDLAASSDGSKMVAAAAGTTGSGGLFVSTDYGKTWNSSFTTSFFTSVASSSDGTHLVAADYGGNIQYSTNSGGSWINIPLTSTTWSGITMSADGSKFAGCIYTGGIFLWSNYGASSNIFNQTTVWDGIAGSADLSRMVACITNGGIYSSVNGAAFSGTAFPTAAWSCICCSSDGLKIAAATANGHIYTSTDGGATYALQAGSPTGNWTSITCSYDGSRIAATLAGGSIYVSGNFGVSWTKQAVVNQSWYGIAAAKDLSFMAAASYDVVNGGRIYYWSPSIQLTTSTIGTTGSLSGTPGSSVELLYIGNNQFMPISSSGAFWAN